MWNPKRWPVLRAFPKAWPPLRFSSLNRSLWDLEGVMEGEEIRKEKRKPHSLGLINYLNKNLQKKRN